jgi:hypothetical protein
VVKQSDKRWLMIAAVVFGIVSMAVSAHWVQTGEIVIRQGSKQRVRTAAEGPVVGRIKSDQLLFYPVCAAWALLGMAMLVLSLLGYFGHNEIFMRLSAFSLAAVLPLGFGTVFLAWLVK